MNRTILLFSIALIIIVCGLTFGCDENNNGPDQTVFTELDFAANSSMSADPENHIVIQFLEHPDSKDQDADTGDTGNDVIPISYKRTLNHTYCWDDDDQDAGHFMILTDSEGMEILRVTANEECATALIGTGSYTMTIHHDGRAQVTHPIFIVPDNALTAKMDGRHAQGILAKTWGFLSDIVRKTNIAYTKPSLAQTTPSIMTIINTLMCVACDLSGADLSNLDFSTVNFLSANMSGVSLANTNLAGANLQSVNFTGTDLTVANLTSATLINAIWTDGSCRCTLQNSVGRCGGCPPCPCDFSSVPMSTACWGAQSVDTFTSLSAGGYGLSGFRPGTGEDTQTLTVDTQTCQIIARDQACAQGVSTVLFPTAEEHQNCVIDIENYVRELNSSGISLLDLPSFVCTQ